MKELVGRYFAWRCRRGAHGPTRVKWGYARGCTECARHAWRWGYR